MFSKIITTPSCSPSYGKCFQSQSTTCKKVSCKNALIAPYLLERNGFNIVSHDLGGIEHRKVIFELWCGDVWLRKGG